MNKKRLSIIISASLLFIVFSVRGDTNIIERVALPSRTHRTWEGVYKFSEESIVKIDGLKDLHILRYRRSGSDGVLVGFAKVQSELDLKILLEADNNPKGATPILEGVDVLPSNDKAEIILRWRHPGNGGFRTIEKYNYTAAGLKLMTRSEFINIDGEKKWISEAALKRRDAEMKKTYPPVREVVRKIEGTKK